MPLYPPQYVAGPSLVHDCYFEYVNASTCRLTRFGGNKLMINGKVETIPENLTVAPYGGQASLGYVQCVALMSAGAMILSWHNEAIAVGPGGMPVPASIPQYTVVGMVFGGDASFRQNNQIIGVVSYFNRRRRTGFGSANVSTGSTSAVELSTAHRVHWVNFEGDHVRAFTIGLAAVGGAGQDPAHQLYLDNVTALGQPGYVHGVVNGAQNNASLHADMTPSLGNHFVTSRHWQSTGAASWNTLNSVMLDG